MTSTSARRLAWASAAALGLWACSHAPSPVEQATSTSSGGDGATGGVGGAGGTGGSTSSGGSGAVGGSAGSGGGTVVAGALTDRDLITRYYIDEADSGQGPTELADAAPDPLPLALTWIPEMGFTENDDGNRGLQWSAIELDGRASVAVDATKISAGVHGSTAGTIEIVAEVHAVSSSSSRLSHIGFDSEGGSFTLAAQSTTRLAFRADGLRARVEHDWIETGRCVVHGVYDSTLADASERLKLYVNGAALPPVEGTPPDLDQVIDLGTERHFVLGNREIGGRSFVGTLYYAAMYGTALTSAEVLQNVGVLLVDDDAPNR